MNDERQEARLNAFPLVFIIQRSSFIIIFYGFLGMGTRLSLRLYRYLEIWLALPLQIAQVLVPCGKMG